jgi:uncharacterized protein
MKYLFFIFVIMQTGHFIRLSYFIINSLSIVNMKTKNQILFLFLLFFSGILQGQIILSPEVHNIPMRDGKSLKADVYLPDTTDKFPCILIQTPYNRTLYRLSGLPFIGKNIKNSAYAFVVVDWRGFYGSLDAAVALPDRGKDAYDVMEWIISQSWSDNQIGTWGPSALGKIQYLAAKEQHPAHICAVPVVAGPQYQYQEYFPGGVYRTEYIETLDRLGYGMSPLLLANPVYNNLWQLFENESMYPEKISTPMLNIGGWFDHNTDIQLEIFDSLLKSSDMAVRDKHKLLMGPWVHNSVGAAFAGELSFSEAAGWSDSFALLFFDYYLLGAKNGYPLNKKYIYFQTGDNTWHQSDVWPENPDDKMHLYLRKEEYLSTEKSSASVDYESFSYDPRDPSPTIGGKTLHKDLLQGPYDQLPVESRNDRLIFSSDTFAEDSKIQGNPSAEIYVSSKQADTDFALRLTDVYPDGRSILLLEAVQRMRFRNGYSAADTQMMQTDQIYRIQIALGSLSHTFKKGHKLRLIITSSNYPRYDKNLNNGGKMYADGDTLIASNTVYFDEDHPSKIILPGEVKLSSFTLSRNSYVLYPNPASDHILIEGLKGENFIYISDMHGRILYWQNAGILEKVKLNLQGFTRGIYFLSIHNEVSVSTYKIIIMK